MSHTTDPADHWEDLEYHGTGPIPELQSQGTSKDPQVLKPYPHRHIQAERKSQFQLQQELTGAQQRTKQLELEAQDRQEGSDQADSNAKEEITRLQETLATTSQEREQAQSAYAELTSKLQYAEQLLEKAKTNFGDKNGRIKALETHLSEARTETDYLTQQLDHIKEESDSVKDELKLAYELRPRTAKVRRAPASPLPSRAGSPVPGMPCEKRGKGATEKASPTPSEETYLTTKLKDVPQSSQRPSQSMDLKDLDKLAKNISKFNPGMPGCQDVQAYLKDIDFHLEMRDNVTDKDKIYLLRMTSSPKHEDIRPPPKEWRPSYYNKERDSQAGTRPKQRGNLNLQAYSHTGLQMKHVAPIHLTVGPMDLVHPIYISPLKTYPLLIGKDLLNCFEPLIDTSQCRVKIKSESTFNIKQQRPGPPSLLTASDRLGPLSNHDGYRDPKKPVYLVQCYLCGRRTPP
ncbi:hypothetical protein QQF64_004513 [Cirrhinus molitorella]|uniref:Uncharacterized protein n=1 Tax=Cirrhinus molitorella TaxID=172907 RepID=A0ABR3MGG2_9TELE